MCIKYQIVLLIQENPNKLLLLEIRSVILIFNITKYKFKMKYYIKKISICTSLKIVICNDSDDSTNINLTENVVYDEIIKYIL